MMGDMTAASPGAPASGEAAATRSGADLADLLRRSARGDEAAFAELYDATSRRLYGMVLRVVRDHAMSEEVTQEVYLDVWRQSARFDPARGSAMSWLLTIAHRAAVATEVTVHKPGAPITVAFGDVSITISRERA